MCVCVCVCVCVCACVHAKRGQIGDILNIKAIGLVISDEFSLYQS